MMIENDFSVLKPFTQELESIREEVADMWIARDRVTKVLHSYQISPKIFRDHFGVKIYDAFIDVIKEKCESRNCLVVHVMLRFFEGKQIKLHSVYEICSELKNIILFHFAKKMNDKVDDLVFWKLADLVDVNFSGVIEEYMQNNCEIIYGCNRGCEEVKKITSIIPQRVEEIKAEKNIEKNHRFEDIRYSKQERYNSDSLFEILDDMAVDKIEMFMDDLNEMLLTLYDLEESNSEKSVILMQEVSATLNEFYALVDTFVVFPVMVRTFQNLSLFLSQITSEMYDKNEQKELLIMHLIGLVNDLEKWIDIIFIQRLADDVHYLDASFANNVLEIEAIFEDKEIVIDDEDDLEFF